MEPITRENFLPYYKTIFNELDQFKQKWTGSFSREIISDFDSMEYTIKDELKIVDYLLDHPLTNLHRFDHLLFEHFDQIIHNELEAIRPRIDRANKLFHQQQDDSGLFYTSL